MTGILNSILPVEKSDSLLLTIISLDRERIQLKVGFGGFKSKNILDENITAHALNFQPLAL